MSEMFALQWPTTNKRKLAAKVQMEDAVNWDDDKKIFIVTDGVTRDEYSGSGHSLALDAAERAARTLMSSYQMGKDIDNAFVQANCEVRQLNRERGLWERHDHLSRDLIGCCAILAVRDEANCFKYGLVGDCGLAHISADGDYDITVDKVAEARQEFPSEESMGVNERKLCIRASRRNNPQCHSKSYGVLTGEDTALHAQYFIRSQVTATKGEVIAIFSDGLRPFMQDDHNFRVRLLSADKHEIQKHVAEARSACQNDDEKTLLLYRV